MRQMFFAPKARDKLVIRLEGLRIEISRIVKFLEEYPDKFGNAAARELRDAENILRLLSESTSRSGVVKRDDYQILIHRVGGALDRSGEIISLISNPQEPRVNIDKAAEMLAVIEADIINSAVQIESYRPDERVKSPPQLLAPVQFEITNGRIAVADQNRVPLQETVDAAAAARSNLVQQSEKIGRALAEANLDQRFKADFDALVDTFRNGNSVALGLATISFDAVTEAYVGEISDILMGRLRGFLIGLGMYAAQDLNWQAFSEQAALVNLTPQAAVEAIETVDVVIAKLQSSPTLADPDVPKTLSTIRGWIRDPSRAAKQTIFGLIRTLENFVSKVWEHFSALVDDIATVTRKRIAQVVGIVAAGQILMSAAQLSGIPMPELAWVKQLPKVVQQVLKEVEHSG